VIGTSGAGIIKVYVKQIYRWAAMTVGTVAVVTMVISGIQISMSGVSGDISSAKTKMMSALAGLVLLFLSGLILYTINPTFFS
jgi:bacteriorhodopsin